MYTLIANGKLKHAKKCLALGYVHGVGPTPAWGPLPLTPCLEAHGATLLVAPSWPAINSAARALRSAFVGHLAAPRTRFLPLLHMIAAAHTQIALDLHFMLNRG